MTKFAITLGLILTLLVLPSSVFTGLQLTSFSNHYEKGIAYNVVFGELSQNTSNFTSDKFSSDTTNISRTIIGKSAFDSAGKDAGDTNSTVGTNTTGRIASVEEQDQGNEEQQDDNTQQKSLTGDSELDNAINDDTPVVDNGGSDDHFGTSVTGSQELDEQLDMGGGENSPTDPSGGGALGATDESLGGASDVLDQFSGASSEAESTGNQAADAMEDQAADVMEDICNLPEPFTQQCGVSQPSESEPSASEDVGAEPNQSVLPEVDYFARTYCGGDYYFSGKNSIACGSPDQQNQQNHECDPTITSCLDAPNKELGERSDQDSTSDSDTGGEGHSGQDTGQGGGTGYSGTSYITEEESKRLDELLDELLRKAPGLSDEGPVMKPDTRSPEEIKHSQELAKYYQIPYSERLNRELAAMEGVFGFIPGIAGGWTCVDCDPYTRSAMINALAGIASMADAAFGFRSYEGPFMYEHPTGTFRAPPSHFGNPPSSPEFWWYDKPALNTPPID